MGSNSGSLPYYYIYFSILVSVTTTRLLGSPCPAQRTDQMALLSAPTRRTQNPPRAGGRDSPAGDFTCPTELSDPQQNLEKKAQITFSSPKQPYSVQHEQIFLKDHT